MYIKIICVAIIVFLLLKHLIGVSVMLAAPQDDVGVSENVHMTNSAFANFDRVDIRTAMSDPYLANVISTIKEEAFYWPFDEDNESARHYLLLARGDALIEDDVELQKLFLDQNVVGIVCRGNLTIRGNLIDEEVDETAAFVHVEGSLQTQSALLGGTQLRVGKNLAARTVVWFRYNHGYSHIGEYVVAENVVVDDYRLDAKGVMRGRFWSRGNLHRFLAPSPVTRFKTFGQFLRAQSGDIDQNESDRVPMAVLRGEVTFRVDLK